MAVTSSDIQGLYIAYFNRPADYLGLQFWTDAANKAGGINAVANAFSASPEYTSVYAGKSTAEIIDTIYMNLFGRHAELDGIKFWGSALDNKVLGLGNIAYQIMKGAQDTDGGFADKTAVASKIAAATAFYNALDTSAEVIGYSGDAANAVVKAWLAGITDQATLDAATTATALDAVTVATVAAHDNVVTAPKSFVLTTGVDAGASFVGGKGNDTFSAGDVAGNAVWTTGDAIDGGAGTDSFTVISNGAIAIPTAATVKNVEVVTLTSGSTIAADTTGWTGLTTLSTTGKGGTGAGVVAAATTDVTVTNTTGGTAVVTGGKSQTVSTDGAATVSGSTGAVKVTSTAQAATAVAVDGGSTVDVTAVGQGIGTIVVGANTAATGAVTVTSSGKYVDGANNIVGAIQVTGGSTVTVNQTAVTAAQATAAATDGTNFTETLSAVTVTGTAATTAVSVSQSAAQGEVDATTDDGVIGIINGAVVINDKVANSATANATIKTVTIDSFGAVSSVNSNALTTINLSGTGADLTVTNGGLTTATVTTQALNLTGLTTTGAVTLDTDVTTLNVSSNTTASTLNSLSASAATAVNISGNAALTLTADTIASSAVVTVTNTAGVTLGTALATGATFVGGAGNDSIKLTAAFTKAHTLGAGNDTVVYAAQGTGGSVDAGAGTADKIVMTAAQADAADADATFNTKFTNFEVLQLSDLTGGLTIDLMGISSVKNVVLDAAAGTVVLNSFASTGTLTLNGSSTSTTLGNTAFAFSGTDVVNVALNSTSIVAAGTIVATGVETVNFNVADASSSGSAAVIHSATLTDATATSIVVTGNNGLTLLNTLDVAVTSFDASGVVANGTADSAANLAVSYTSANSTTTAAVSIKGGAGADTLTGNAAIDTIVGGAGADTINGAAGNDILTGGEGADTITGGTGNDTINLTETTAAADIVVMTAAATNGIDTITGFAAGSSGTDTVKLVLGDTTAATTTGNNAVFTTTTAALVAGNAAYVTTGSTTTSDIIEIDVALSSFGNLAANGVVDGSELLKALGSTNVAAGSITATTVADSLYVVAYQGGNAYLYLAADANSNGAIVASEIQLVGVFNGVAQGAFASGDFTV